MEQNLSKAFTEVYEILKVTPIELTSKIPTKFRKIIEENRDKYRKDFQRTCYSGYRTLRTGCISVVV